MFEVYLWLFRVGGCFDPESLATVGDEQGRYDRQQASHHVEHRSLTHFKQGKNPPTN
jgi:hypothetical protein